MNKLMLVCFSLLLVQACGGSSTDTNSESLIPLIQTSRYDNSGLDPEVIQSFKDLEELMLAASGKA